MRHVVSTALVAVVVGALAGLTASTMAQTPDGQAAPLEPAAVSNINAHRVDGKHAVGFTTVRTNRKGKLVATNSSGFLPNNIIQKATNADRLDGRDSTAFATLAALKSDAGAINDGDNPVHWKQLVGVPSGIADGIDSVGSVGYFSGVQVTQSTPLGAGGSETWFTFGWSSSYQVLWSVVPTNQGSGQEQLLLTVRTERAGDGTITYWLTVANNGNVASGYRLRYVAFNSSIAPASRFGPAWHDDVGVRKTKRDR